MYKPLDIKSTIRRFGLIASHFGNPGGRSSTYAAYGNVSSKKSRGGKGSPAWGTNTPPPLNAALSGHISEGLDYRTLEFLI